MKYYSFAGEVSGTTDPEETHIYDVTGGECSLEGCTTETCNHTVIMWSGGEYSKRNTWIAAEEKYTVSLEEVR